MVNTLNADGFGIYLSCLVCIWIPIPKILSNYIYYKKIKNKKRVRVGSGYPQLQGDLAENRVGPLGYRQAGRGMIEYQIRKSESQRTRKRYTLFKDTIHWNIIYFLFLLLIPTEMIVVMP